MATIFQENGTIFDIMPIENYNIDQFKIKHQVDYKRHFYSRRHTAISRRLFDDAIFEKLPFDKKSKIE